MSDASERELRDRIEATRTRLGDTVEEIGARVNPDRVEREIRMRARNEVDELKTTVKRKARNTMRDIEHEVEDRGRGLWRTIRDNPIPAAMVGVGMGWMMANGGSHDRESGRRPSTVYGPAEPYTPGYPATLDARRAGGSGTTHAVDAGDGESTMSHAKERAGEAADRVRDTGAEMADRASDAASRGREQVREVRHRATEWGDRAGHRAKRAERRVEHAIEDNPLAAGAMAAALGFAAGLMVPESQREHELMGSTRDRVVDRARDGARRTTEKVRETAREAAGDAARHAVDQAMKEPGRGT